MPNDADQTRTMVERRLVRQIVRECKKAGFVPVKVWDDGDYVPATNEAAVLEAVFSVSVSTIHFAPKDNLKRWGNLGVMIVCGNGVDCISDWHCGNEEFDKAVTHVTRLSEEIDLKQRHA